MSKMSYDTSLILPYKGGRDYIHGTDIYNSVLNYFRHQVEFPSHSHVKFSFHGVSRNQPDLSFRTSEEPNVRDGRVRALFSIGDNINGCLIESDRVVDKFMPYEERDTYREGKLAGSVARAVTVSQFSTIEALVSLTKHLHIEMFPSEASWLFTKLDLKKPLEDGGGKKIRLKLIQNLGRRLTKTLVVLDEEEYGFIYFSTAKL